MRHVSHLATCEHKSSFTNINVTTQERKLRINCDEQVFKRWNISFIFLTIKIFITPFGIKDEMYHLDIFYVVKRFDMQYAYLRLA